ncbi:MAG: antirestriction protein ArdA [Propionibacteriaceae bacterium]|nr:antirestriction protein ArdA [Propionibacteriaceae bacterium]
MTTMTEEVPRIWVGCLHCYNSGDLVGEWFPATDADDVAAIDLAAVHKGSGRRYAACEELWVMDHELIPTSGEFGLLEAAQWAACYEEAGAEQWPAVFAWVRSGMHVVEGHGDIPSLSSFEERYVGRWESFRAYAEQLADDLDMMNGWPEEAQRYFHWSSWVDDLQHDYTVVDAPRPDYGVYVFRNM